MTRPVTAPRSIVVVGSSVRATVTVVVVRAGVGGGAGTVEEVVVGSVTTVVGSIAVATMA
jgi:hypothetical protein